MGSVFMSPHYKAEPVSSFDMKIASLAWGFTIGFSILTSSKAARQTLKIWRRSKGFTVYMSLIWLEMLVSTIFGIICWFHLDGVIPPSFAFFFTILTMWALQVQFLLQIIINRIGLLIPNKRKVMYIKWGVAALITAINISVYNIWVPARLQASERYIEINVWWDRCEKAIYLIVDGMLNAYFLWLVHSRLLSAGMSKYRAVFRFNAMIVGVSLSMDVLIISMMSLKNTFTYMQFHPVAYIVKLNIEMTMAELISKVAKEPHRNNQQGSGPSNAYHSMDHEKNRSRHGPHVDGGRLRGSGRNSYGTYQQHARPSTKPYDLEDGYSNSGSYQVWVDSSMKSGTDSKDATIVNEREVVAFPQDVHSNPMTKQHTTIDDRRYFDNGDQQNIYGDNIIMKTIETTVTSEIVNDQGGESDRSSITILRT